MIRPHLGDALMAAQSESPSAKIIHSPMSGVKLRILASPSCGGIAADMLWLCKPLDPLMDEL